MPNYLMMNSYIGGGTTNYDETEYYNPVGDLSVAQPDDVSANLITRDTYTLKGLYLNVTSNSLNAAATVRSRKNGANGAQSVSIPAGNTGVFEDAVNSDSLVSGDLFCTQAVGGGTTGNFSYHYISYILSTVSATTPILAAGGIAVIGDGETRYFYINGHGQAATPEASVQYRFRVVATFSNLRIYVNANSLDGAATVRTRKNGANGAQSVSIGAGATGAFEDAVNTDSISVGDNVNYQGVAGGTTGNVQLSSTQVKSNSAGKQVCVSAAYADTLGFGTTGYGKIEGTARKPPWLVDDAAVRVTARASFSGKNMYVYIAANSLDGSTTIRTRKNGANGNLSVSIGAAATGQFEDLVNTDSFVATDYLNWQVVTGGTSGTIEMLCIGFELQQPPPAVGLENKSANMAAKMMAAGVL